MTLLFFVGLLSTLAQANPYPAHWFAPVERDPQKTWEILPQEASPGEVILSKRHELGLLSNFAATPFTYRGKKYASLEGLWQSMLFPEDSIEGQPDPRASLKWPHTRAQVEQMVAFEAKAAGKIAEAHMRQLGIDWVSFEGKRFPYRPAQPGEHYRIIVEAMRAKLEQNAPVKAALLSTGTLRLKPDHHPEPHSPHAWRYYEIWENLRAELRAKH
jgi:predicted NAD-dependent protein-ADP-ribosyltransferase YbiA (DUF1768 family)